MPLFREVDLSEQIGGKIDGVAPGSVAADIGLVPGDELLAVNDHPVEDVIDVHYYAAEEYLELLVRREDEYFLFEAFRQYQQPLGVEFAHPTFDTDIRRCNNLCEFCFVLQMAPRFRRTLYIKDDDYRYSFLFGHFVTLTNLTEHDWWRIEAMGLSPLYISVHVTDLEMRRRFLRNRDAPDIMEQLRWLAARDVEMHTQLVMVPGFNDGAWLERSIRDLETVWPAVRSVSIVPVGLTRHHKYGLRPHTVAEAEETLAYVEALQLAFREKLGVRFVYPSDEWYLVTGQSVPTVDAYDGLQLHENGLGMVRRFLDDWENVRREISIRRESQPLTIREVTLVTGTLFAPTLRKVATQFSRLAGVNVAVLAAVNERLGETITAAGLLMANDIVEQLQGTGYGDLVVLPRVVFDHPDLISLDGQTPIDVATALGRPVALADLMGDVWDALTGTSLVVYEPRSSGE
jgi:putative radical SAM enzyme (TIGR03279 family)